MLTLTRRPGESILVWVPGCKEPARLTILPGSTRKKVFVGCEATRAVRFLRAELQDQPLHTLKIPPPPVMPDPA